MAIVLMTGIAILVVIFFGGLFSIIAVEKSGEKLKIHKSRLLLAFGKFVEDTRAPLLPNICTTYKVSDFDDAELEG